MALAAQNMDVLGNMDNIKILSNVLKTNVSACTSIGSFYLPQIGRIFMDMLGLYKAVSGIVSEQIAREGIIVAVVDPSSHAEIARRSNCNKDTKDPATSYGKERGTQIDGDVHKEG